MTIFSLAHQLVGMEKLLVDMMMEAEYVVPLFEACAEYQTQIGLRLIEKGVDAVLMKSLKRTFSKRSAFWAKVEDI